MIKTMLVYMHTVILCCRTLIVWFNVCVLLNCELNNCVCCQWDGLLIRWKVKFASQLIVKRFDLEPSYAISLATEH